MIHSAKPFAAPAALDAPIIERRFTLTDPRKGKIEITGLGYFVLYINGNRVSANLFTPALTDYAPRDMSHWNYPLFDTTTHRLFYLTYELTPYLKDGENRLEILLGNGWYRQPERIAEGNMSFGDRLLFMYAASFETGEGEITLLSDGSELARASHIVYNNLFIGEIWDSVILSCRQKEYPVEVLSPFWDILEEQTCPPDRVIRTVIPKYLGIADGRKLYDAGENLSGRVRIPVLGKAGASVTLRFAEELSPDRKLDFLSTGSNYICVSGKKQIQTDTCVSSGSPMDFAPEFTYHTFRYFDVEGEAGEPTVEVIHTDLPVISHFSCSDDTLNWLYQAYIRTQQDNIHGCIPSDCPHRERLGYTGDGQITAKACMLTLDAKGVYRKWITDILDCQDQKGGHIQHTAPLMGGGGGPGGWGCAVFILPHEFYRHYGDSALLMVCYPAMKKYLSYLEAHTENGLVTSEEKGGWCLGDWASAEEMQLPEAYVNSFYLADAYRRMAEIAPIVGHAEEAEYFRKKESFTKEAIVRTFCDRSSGSFCGGIQGADAYAVLGGFAPDRRTLDNLVSRYSSSPLFDTGFLGTAILINALFRSGKADLAYALLSSHAPQHSFGYMQDCGATTIWEYFTGACSHCHPMFGGCVSSFFEYLLGIGQANGSAGYVVLSVNPVFPKGLTHACGDVLLPCGKVTVSWKRLENKLTINLSLPCEASVFGQSFSAGEHTIIKEDL